MIRPERQAWRLAVVVGLWAGSAAGQQLPPAPVPVSPAPRGPQFLGDAPPNTVLGPPRSAPVPPPPPFAPAPRFVPPPEPPPEMPYIEPPGWFANLELNLLAPHVKNRVTGTVAITGFDPSPVHLPTAELDWTAAPRFEVGYRLPDALGEVVFGYRFLATEGTAQLIGFDATAAPAFLRSRLDAHVFDLDYATHELALGPYWDVKGRVGVRLATAYFDSQAQGQILGQRTSNHFVGAGPRAGIDAARWLDWNDLAVFLRLEGAVLPGRVSQSFEETLDLGDGFQLGGASRHSGAQTVPMLSFDVGLRWTPREGSRSRYTFGYHWERWWDVGRLGDSRGDVWLQGIFLRGEFNW